ncbi:MAG: hypothetical protein ACKO3T_18135 [Planctomycetaceae bacterium]
MLNLLETWMPSIGASLAVIIAVLGLLGWLKQREIFADWTEQLSREPSQVSTKAELLIEKLASDLQAGAPAAILRGLTSVSPICALAMTAFTYRNLQLSQLKATQLTLSEVFAAMQPVYLPMSVLACITLFSMLVSGMLGHQADRILSRARREPALYHCQLEQPLEQINNMLLSTAQILGNHLSQIESSMELCRRQFDGLPDVASQTVLKVQTILSDLPSRLETATDPLLKTVNQTQNELASLNLNVSIICQNLRTAGHELASSVAASATHVTEASERLTVNQASLTKATSDLTNCTRDSASQVQLFTASLQANGIDTLLANLSELPTKISRDLQQSVSDTVQAQLKTHIRQQQARQSQTPAAAKARQQKSQDADSATLPAVDSVNGFPAHKQTDKFAKHAHPEAAATENAAANARSTGFFSWKNPFWGNSAPNDN